MTTALITLPIEVADMEKGYINEFIQYLLSITETELVQPEE